MDYERFKEGFQDALKAELAVRGADVELTARRVDKMNDSYDAITVRPTDSSIGVNISVEKAFAAYENGTPIPEIAEHFADAVEKGFRESPQVDLESISDYEQMKSKLSMEVVSAEKNAELLESVPHERMEDMAVVYRFVLDQTDSGNGTILVTNQLLDQYGITKEQLRADAMENAPEIRPSEIRGMSEVMSELAPGMIPEVAPEDEQMFVATVPDKIHGAGVIAYPNFMEDAAQKMGGDFFVLPSSIHEVLLVKDNGQMTAKELENMVKEVNATQVFIITTARIIFLSWLISMRNVSVRLNMMHLIRIRSLEILKKRNRRLQRKIRLRMQQQRLQPRSMRLLYKLHQ